ncbi:DUF397 domain-containing protein [Streptomyces gelaticus]|uniref:DUF397 domain-containing protein n=1 Tax=Streptomyces gelaticus TaxID=285446 RepID=A0ABQ2W7R8_9ACTN|nr:DUF397 domain-containing protein [Streptomyces gelaticus]GGV92499.1 DUF397 domain-containing protein [Streptomyces gelaticus]
MIRNPPVRDTPELKWFKSSYSSSGDGNDCIEVAATPGTIHVRDSKNISDPWLAVTPMAWTDFVNYASTN